MPIDLDCYLGLHATSLRLREQRTELLANNLANADTPDFKARDLDFSAALNAALKRQEMGQPAAPSGAAEAGPHMKYRTPLAPALDGNTVDVQLEQANFAENAVRYQATLTFLSSRLRGLMTAITGQ